MKKYKNTADLIKDLDIDEGLKQRIIEDYKKTEISHYLSALRCKHGLSEKEMADKLGCDEDTVSEIENSYDRNLRLKDISKYVKAFGINIIINCSEDNEYNWWFN